MFKNGRRAAVALLAAGGMIAGGALVTGSATAASKVTGADIAGNTITQGNIAGGGVSGHALTPQSEIQTNSLTQLDIHAGGVSGSAGDGEDEIQKGSIGVDDLSEAAQDALKGAQGPAGETGPAGEKGEKGDKGDPGVTNVEADGPYPGATQLTNGGNSTAKWTGDGGASQQVSWVRCADGKTAIGGGFSRADEGAAAEKALQIVSSMPAQIDADGNLVYNPIEGDEDGSFKPNGWVVEGYNNGDTDLIVRPWIICANVG